MKRKRKDGMPLIIILDAGHGYQTSGKQSPNGMKEYEFNRAVAQYVKNYLANYLDTKVYFAHEDTRDVPLLDRTTKANTLKADLYVSIHANASGTSGWNDANGIETYIYQTKPKEALALAETVQAALIQETNLKNRGVKTANFHVLRETHCTSILIECGFMTNKHEATLLQSTSFRQKCGQAITKSIVAYYKLQKKEPNETLYKVQVGAFHDKNKADVLAEQLKKLGFEAFITSE